MQIRIAARRLAALVAASAIISCSVDRSPTAPPAPQAELVGDLSTTLKTVTGTLLTCTPQAFRTDSALIGSAGGTLNLGPHSLVIPRGALARTVWIKGTVVRDTVNSVRFAPEGLTFAKSASLNLSYRNCDLVAGLLTPKRVAYTTENLRILEFLPSTDNVLTRTVTGKLSHFSRYAAAW